MVSSMSACGMAAAWSWCEQMGALVQLLILLMAWASARDTTFDAAFFISMTTARIAFLVVLGMLRVVIQVRCQPGFLWHSAASTQKTLTGWSPLG